MKTTTILALAFLLSLNLTFSQSENSKITVEETLISATLSGTVFVTKNLEKSIQFYTNFLGFKEYKRIVLDTPSGVEPFGFSGDKKLNYVSLVPAVWSKDNRNFPGLSFIEVIDGETNVFSQNGKRQLVQGEIIKGYSVKGLKLIEEKMRKAGVTFVTPMLTSPSGKSLTLTILDPNGVRIQMYEYLKK